MSPQILIPLLCLSSATKFTNSSSWAAFRKEPGIILMEPRFLLIGHERMRRAKFYLRTHRPAAGCCWASPKPILKRHSRSCEKPAHLPPRRLDESYRDDVAHWYA